jgi:L-malate glycosyltransferase
MRICLAGPVRIGDLAPWLDVGDGGAGDLPPGLGQTPVTMLARGLLRRGVSLTIATLDLTVDREVVLEGPALRLCVQPFRDRHRGRDAYRVERRLLVETLRREAPDLVHAHWSYEYALAGLRSGAPTLVTVHDWAPTILRWMPDPYRAVRLGMYVAATARARYFTAVSPYMAAKVRRWRRVGVQVVPNALEDGAFDDRDRELQRDAPVLVAINDGFVPWKNVGRLLQAYRLARATRPGARLVLVGNGYGPDGDAEQWAAARGLTSGVEFRGPVPYEQIRELLAGADLLVHPSLEESFGMVLLEAMAQRVPVIGGARSGAVPWVLDHGGAGVLTDITSPSAIAAAITGLLDDPARWSALSRAGYDRAWNEFRLDRVVDGYLRAYDRVGAARRGAGVTQ